MGRGNEAPPPRNEKKEEQVNATQRTSIHGGEGSSLGWDAHRISQKRRINACLVSKERALEISAWARIVDGALKREANSAFLGGEIERATSFLPLIAYTEQLADLHS